MADLEILEALPVDAAPPLPPQGQPCEACGTPVEPLDRFCPACGTPNPAFAAAPSEGGRPLPIAKRLPVAKPLPTDAPVPPSRRADEEAAHKHFRCSQCGSEILTDPDQRSFSCPFCDSTYVAEFTPEQSHRQPPEFVIGFAITPEQAQEKFRAWLKERAWYRPSDLHLTAIVDKMKGVYLPFWSFSMLAQSGWRAQIGEHWYRTETYTTTDSKGNTVTRTRQVQETEWWPLTGYHHRYYGGFLVSGSRGLPQREAERIKPFQLPALRRYEPYFLAGWLCEEYSVDRADALSLCQQEFRRQELRNIAGFLPGDTHASLEANTEFSQVNSDLCLLPVYLCSYQYQGKLYRFLLNGQTGRFDGDKPVSGQRIAIAVGIGLAIALVIFLLIFLIATRF